MTNRVCAKCGVTVTDADASFCSRCGSSLLQGATDTQSIRQNSGNALNISLGGGVLNGGIRVSTSMSANPYQLSLTSPRGSLNYKNGDQEFLHNRGHSIYIRVIHHIRY